MLNSQNRMLFLKRQGHNSKENPPLLKANTSQMETNPFAFTGVLVSLFAPLALSCDLMALRGLRTWRKALLLPWLVLYAILVALVMSVVLTGTFHSGFHWRYLLLGLCCLCFFSAWRQVRLQYSAMSLPR